jgi:hypothetical protein
MTRRRFNPRERFKLRLTAFNRCEACGAPLDRAFHADHRIAFSKGGPTTLRNGQALCAPCNLRKGGKEMNDMVITPAVTAIYPNIANRDWQQKALQAWSKHIDDDKQDFFVEGCPGSGKTRFAIAAIKHAFNRNDIDMVIVVAPTEVVHDQWIKEADERGVKLRHWSSERLGDSILSGKFPLGGVGSNTGPCPHCGH